MKKHGAKWKIFYLLPLLLLSLQILFSSCEKKFEPPRTDFNANDVPDQESWNTTVYFSDSGDVKAILKAGHIKVYNTKAITLIDSGAVVQFFRNKQIVSTLSGKRGKVFDSSKDIEVNDSVVVINTEGSILQTEKLYWTDSTRRVSSDVFVKIKTPKEEIQGIGFESDQSLKDYVIYKVTGIF